jgi:membrane protein YqaA with SNARE-associated domain
MRPLFHSLFGFLLTWWGAFILAAVDTSIFFFVPFGNDALVVYLVARTPTLYWLYPLITTSGSTLGAAGTYWIGRKAGEKGLPRLVSMKRVERLRRKVENAGVVALSIPAIMPPPFPLTPFVLTCGAIGVNATRFLFLFAGMRLVRFGTEAWLAHRYGRAVLLVLQSDTFRLVIGGFAVIAVAGTVISGAQLWRRTRQR